MKTLINISILLIILNDLSFPQFYADSVTPDYVIEFMKIADENAKSIDSLGKAHKKFSSEELYHIAKLYYKCYNDDPVGFQQFVEEKHKEWEKAPFEVTSENLKMRPWLKVYALRDKIAYKFGIPFTEIIGCPALVRAKFDSSYHSTIYISDLKIDWGVRKFVFIVDEVLKGNKLFRGGNKFVVTYSPNAESPIPEIEEGKIYLVPIMPLLDSEDYNGEISFSPLRDYYDRWAMGKPPKTFPIENEIIKNCEYFGIKDTNWTDFKKFFKDKYLIFD